MVDPFLLESSEVAMGLELMPPRRKPKPLSWRTERAHWKRGIYTIVGVDEAGRGPLAGPVVAAAVYFTYERCLKFPNTLRDLNDSKQLDEYERDRFYNLILKHAEAWGVGIVPASVIDEINILQATMRAMTIAVDAVATKLVEHEKTPEMILVDGNYFRTKLPYEYQTVIDGDAKSPMIAAASVIAKVTRDRIMKELDLVYPQYNFKQHKGYGTQEHLKALKEHGPSPEHRMSFGRTSRLQEEFSFEDVYSDESLLELTDQE